MWNSNIRLLRNTSFSDAGLWFPLKYESNYGIASSLLVVIMFELQISDGIWCLVLSELLFTEVKLLQMTVDDKNKRRVLHLSHLLKYEITRSIMALLFPFWMLFSHCSIKFHLLRSIHIVHNRKVLWKQLNIHRTFISESNWSFCFQCGLIFNIQHQFFHYASFSLH